VALASDTFYVVGEEYTFQFNATKWGWNHLRRCMTGGCRNVTRDLSQLDQLSAVGRKMDRLNDDLTLREEEVQGLGGEQEIVIANLEQERAAADKLHADAKKNYADVYQRYKEEQARRAAAGAAAKAAAPKLLHNLRQVRRLVDPVRHLTDRLTPPAHRYLGLRPIPRPSTQGN
jgi:hypothetical protein